MKAEKKLPRRKVEVKQPEQNYVFPTLTMRQAAILLECIKHGMAGDVSFADGKYVSAQEWQDLIHALFRR